MRFNTFLLCLVAFSVQAVEPLRLNVNGQALEGATIESGVSVSLPTDFDHELTLRWNRNADPVAIDGYRVFYGKPGSALKVFGDVVQTAEGVSPQVTMKASELGASLGGDICFRLRAFRDTSESGYSEEICTKLTGIKSVAFYVDDTELAGAPVLTDTASPFAYDLAGLSPGEHTLTALISHEDGETVRRSAFFLIKQTPPENPTGASVTKKPL